MDYRILHIYKTYVRNYFAIHSAKSKVENKKLS